MNEALTIVMGYRDRNLERVDRCLTSLAVQTRRDFVVHVVDYGSRREYSEASRRMVGRFPFCRYIHTDTRGWVWSRSRALNVGLRLAESPFVLTTDVDMIFGPEFIEALLEAQDGHKLVHCSPRWLPCGFDKWDALRECAPRFPVGDHSQRGGCQCFSLACLHRLRGFDEAYVYWGREDADFACRVLALGIEEVWIEDRTNLYHQWHPALNHSTQGFMPSLLWGRQWQHFIACREQLVRNTDHWGRMITSDDRPVYRFVDRAAGCCRDNVPGLIHFDDDPADINSIAGLFNSLSGLQAGQALAVSRSTFPLRTRVKDRIILASQVLGRCGISLRLSYPPNVLHDVLTDCLCSQPAWAADYFLGLPDRQGTTVIVKR